jgi:hypothetical protein
MRSPVVDWVLFLGQEVVMESGTPRRNFKLFGELHPNAKLTRDQVIEIREELKIPGTSRMWLARRYGVSRSAIDMVVRGVTWKEAL